MRVLVALALAIGLLASHASEARGYYGYRGVYYGPRVGFYVGSPWYWGPSWYWGAPYYGAASWGWGVPLYGYGYPYGWGYPAWRYGAPVAYAGAPVYTERDVPPAAPAPPSGSWYYCADPPGYYPHVSMCNRPWLAVAPFAVR